MNLDDRETEHRLLIFSIEFTRLIGAEILVCHSGRYRPEENFGLPRQPMSLLVEEKMWHAEVAALQEMSHLAADAGVLLGMENARPYLDGNPYYRFLRKKATRTGGKRKGRPAPAARLGGNPAAGCFIPLRDVFCVLNGYKGVLTMELRPRCRQYAGEALAGLRDLCATVPVDNSYKL